MMNLNKLRTDLERRKGERDLLERQKKQKQQSHRGLGILYRKLEEAQVIVRQAALQTQQELQYHISSITTMAMEAIFPDPYELQVEFVERSGRTEVDISFSDGENKIDPLLGSGGGPVDVAAFSLRASLWKLQNPKPQNVMVLDEPFRFLSQDLQPKAAEMLQQISKQLGLQIIMITHNPALIDSADQLFEITQRRKISQVVANE
jgi:DNA repair exonuclease SbcCD ATPase subunit